MFLSLVLWKQLSTLRSYSNLGLLPDQTSTIGIKAGLLSEGQILTVALDGLGFGGDY